MTSDPLTAQKPHPIKEAFLRLTQHPLVIVVLVLIAAGCFFAGNYIYSSILVSQGEKIASIEAKNQSDALAREVNRFLDEKQHNIRNFANREAIVSAFKEGDRVKVTQMESLITLLSKDIIDGQLLFPNDQRLDTTRNFTARELFFQAMEGQQPAPVAVRLEQGWALLLAYAVVNTDDNSPMGALITTIDFASLKERFTNLGAPGSGSLIQDLPGISAQTLFTVKPNNLSHIDMSATTDVPEWRVVFTADNQLLGRSSPTAMEVIQLAAVFTVLALLLMYLVIRFTYSHYRNEPLPVAKKKKTREKPDADAESFIDYFPSSEASKPERKEPPETAAKQDEQPLEEQPADKPAITYPDNIFREYDIRGIYDNEITNHFAKELGKVLGTKAQSEGETSIITAFDGRVSSPALCEALEQGVLSTGCDVIKIGQVPTPMLNFATQQIEQTSCGVMVTASHNPADYNGFKITIGNRSLKSDEVKALKQAMEANATKSGMGEKTNLDIVEQYQEAIELDIIPATDLKLVIDAGNGIAGKYAPGILEKLGCTVIPLYCEVDGTFPNHEADTTNADNLKDLIDTVRSENADLGIALDGDGDRLVAVTDKGEIVWPDQLMMIFARDIISRQPGADIIFDIKSTRRLNSLISSYGGRPIMWKTGHSNIRNKTLENDSPLGGEFSGHIFFRDRWHGFDDGIYAAARLIEIMSTREQSLEEMISGFESSYSTPEIKVDVADEHKFRYVEAFAEMGGFEDASVSRIDGIRVDYPDSWGLLRASNTTPALTLRFEATTLEELENIQATFRTKLQTIDSSLTF